MDNNAAMDLRFQTRYALEHQILPQELYSENGPLLLLRLLKERETFFVDTLGFMSRKLGIKCPYDRSDFAVKPQLVSKNGGADKIAVIIIDMPEPEMPPLCSKLIICHGLKPVKILGYYTVEKSIGDTFMLCGWTSGGGHFLHSPAPASEKELLAEVLKPYTSK